MGKFFDALLGNKTQAVEIECKHSTKAAYEQKEKEDIIDYKDLSYDELMDLAGHSDVDIEARKIADENLKNYQSDEMLEQYWSNGDAPKTQYEIDEARKQADAIGVPLLKKQGMTAYEYSEYLSYKDVAADGEYDLNYCPEH